MQLNIYLLIYIYNTLFFLINFKLKIFNENVWNFSSFLNGGNKKNNNKKKDNEDKKDNNNNNNESKSDVTTPKEEVENKRKRFFGVKEEEGILLTKFKCNNKIAL